MTASDLDILLKDDQLKNRQVNGRYFTGNGFPGWKGTIAMSYMDLLPEAEHMIVLAE